MKKKESMKGTAKERVRRRWPEAYAFNALTWRVYRGTYGHPIGVGSTARAAWADAARSLKGKK